MKSKQSIEMGKWLNDSIFNWNFFCTFTTQYKLTMKSARRMMERLYSSVKAEYPDAQLYWVAEPFSTSRCYHIHALIGLNDNSNEGKYFILKIWKKISASKSGYKSNRATVYGYDKNKGANYYVAKYLDHNDTDSDIYSN